MKYTILSALIIGIIHANVYATLSHHKANPLQEINEHQVADNSFSVAWTRDANSVKTLCDSNHPLWQSFNLEGISHNSGRSSEQICAENGVMNWYEANAWISHLNSNSYLGHTDWRLPSVDLNDPACSVHIGSADAQRSASFGQGCSNSELGHLYQTVLSTPSHKSTLFTHLSDATYWSSSELPINHSLVGIYDLEGGWQDAVGKSSDLLNVWPIHSL